MVALGEMMSCLGITMMKETRVEECKRYVDWDGDELMEHVELDRLCEEMVGTMDDTGGEMDVVMDMEQEHEYLDEVMNSLSQMVKGWSKLVHEKSGMVWLVGQGWMMKTWRGVSG